MKNNNTSFSFIHLHQYTKARLFCILFRRETDTHFEKKKIIEIIKLFLSKKKICNKFNLSQFISPATNIF